MSGSAEAPASRRANIAGFLRWLGFAALTLLTMLLGPPILLFTGYVAFYLFVPAFSAHHEIKTIDADVTLKFYMAWNETTDSGRYLKISGRTGSHTLHLCGFDWAHWSRTSLYLTQDRDIAILGAWGCDYVFGMESSQLSGAYNAPSDGWTYLGAFQLVQAGPNGQRLRFIDASEQNECIEADNLGGPLMAAMPRRAARQQRCPPPPMD